MASHWGTVGQASEGMEMLMNLGMLGISFEILGRFGTNLDRLGGQVSQLGSVIMLPFWVPGPGLPKTIHLDPDWPILLQCFNPLILIYLFILK